MDELHDRVRDEVPGVEVEPLQLMEDLLGDLTGRPQPVVVNLFGPDEKQLTDLSEQITKLLGHINGLSSIESSVAPSGDSLNITVDRVKAALEGVDPDVVSRQINDLIAGAVATRVAAGEKTMGVRVWTPPKVRRTDEDLLRLPLRAPDGHLFPVGRVATIATRAGEPQLTRQDLQRVIAVTARSDRDLGSTMREVKAALDRPGVIPPSVRYTLGGQYQEQQTAFLASARVGAAGAALVFLLLLVLYERFRVAAAILLTVALAIAAVFVGLWLTSTELNISSLMGLVMIIGNVTEVAIFYYSEYAALPRDAEQRHRLTDAGRLPVAGHHDDNARGRASALAIGAGSWSYRWPSAAHGDRDHHGLGSTTAISIADFANVSRGWHIERRAALPGGDCFNWRIKCDFTIFPCLPRSSRFSLERRKVSSRSVGNGAGSA